MDTKPTAHSESFTRVLPRRGSGTPYLLESVLWEQSPLSPLSDEPPQPQKPWQNTISVGAYMQSRYGLTPESAQPLLRVVTQDRKQTVKLVPQFCKFNDGAVVAEAVPPSPASVTSRPATAGKAAHTPCFWR